MFDATVEQDKQGASTGASVAGGAASGGWWGALAGLISSLLGRAGKPAPMKSISRGKISAPTVQQENLVSGFGGAISSALSGLGKSNKPTSAPRPKGEWV